MLIIVLPYSCASFESSLQILFAIKESRPEVGSSSKIILGSVINSTPIAVRFLSPPEIVFFRTLPIIVSLHFSSPKSWINFVMRCSYSSILTFNLKRAANLKASVTVKYAKSTSSCIT